MIKQETKVSAVNLDRALNSLTYSSKTFSITADKLSLYGYQLSVWDETSKELIEQSEVKDLGNIDYEYERLKTKYIFDYYNRLIANQKIIR